MRNEEDFDYEEQQDQLAGDVLELDELENVKTIILENQTINVKNCLRLNKAYSEELKKLKFKLESILDECEKKYEENEALLMNLNTTTSKEGSSASFTPRITKATPGYPYFKTDFGAVPPPNKEALYRKANKELYPMDYRGIQRYRWILSDKSLLVKTVKEQMIKYLSVSARHDPKETSKIVKRSLKRLCQDVSSSTFTINWGQVCDALFNRHNSNECLTMWNQYLHPDLKKKSWTEEENRKLVDSVSKYKCQNWHLIAKAIPNRSPFQCFVYYQSSFNDLHNYQQRNKFSLEEDKKLLELIEKHRFGSVIPWTKIQMEFGSRTKTALYYRYEFSLKSTINKEPFSMEEDIIFMAAIQQYGVNFKRIAAEFPNRTMVQIRQHYNNVLKTENIVKWNYDDDIKLINYYEHDRLTWAEIAKILTGHSRTSCRTRYQTIKNFLAKNPNKTIKDVGNRDKKSKNGVTKSNWVEKVNEIGDKVNEKNLKNKKDFTPNNKMIEFLRMAKHLDIKFSSKDMTLTRKAFDESEVIFIKNARLLQKQKFELEGEINPSEEISHVLNRILSFQDRLTENKRKRKSPYASEGGVDLFKKRMKLIFGPSIEALRNENESGI